MGFIDKLSETISQQVVGSINCEITDKDILLSEIEELKRHIRYLEDQNKMLNKMYNEQHADSLWHRQRLFAMIDNEMKKGE